MQNLAGKTAIVTGGASGIGLGISRALLAAGMNVAIGDLRETELAAAREALGSPDNLVALPLDVTDRQAYAAFADAVEARFGKIHLLANNAGVVVSGPVEQASFSDWDWVIDVNLRGTANGIVIVLPKILSHGEGGHIVNTASTSGIMPHPGAAIYVATKSAIVGMSEAMRGELEPRGVIVSVLCPGPVRSRITDAGRNRSDDYAGSGYEPGPMGGGGELPPWMMGADEVGELVREGVEKDWLYILTHNEHGEGLAERAAALQAALPDRPLNEDLMSAMTVTLRNPVHAAEIARHQKKH